MYSILKIFYEDILECLWAKNGWVLSAQDEFSIQKQFFEEAASYLSPSFATKREHAHHER